jgi:hypothetical protein
MFFLCGQKGRKTDDEKDDVGLISLLMMMSVLIWNGPIEATDEIFNKPVHWVTEK